MGAKQLRFPAGAHRRAERIKFPALLEHLLGERERYVEQAIKIVLALLAG
ncbi:MAG: hypothetical protein J2P27_03225 [Actinobacteria bacterium]|nr:hypothetical protein [Actinomycetota bacterium]